MGKIGLLLLVCAHPCFSYSVLTHEAIIDSAWESTLKPLILARYPDLTPDQLREAHAYAYGGAIIQDMGYYPFGSKLFSDLVHYVHSGDFVTAMLRDANNADQFAFALGSLAHFASDRYGHPEGVNRVVPMLYPRVRRKFGLIATYEDNPSDHLKTEFGFDVLEVAKHRYAPEAYHDFIGFKVDRDLLERAFQETYSVPLKSVFADFDFAVGTFRATVSGLIPKMTKVAWSTKQSEIEKSEPGITRQRFRYNMSRSSYEQEWGKSYKRPGIGARILAFFLRLLPKIGPLRALAFKMPTPPAEQLLMASFNDALDRYVAYTREIGVSQFQLEDANLDTGAPAKAGAYRMADDTFQRLLEKLAKENVQVSPPLRASILAFYGNSGHLSHKAARELETLRTEGR